MSELLIAFPLEPVPPRRPNSQAQAPSAHTEAPLGGPPDLNSSAQMPAAGHSGAEAAEDPDQDK